MKRLILPALLSLLPSVAATATDSDGEDALPAGVQAVLAHRNIPPDSLSIYVENLGTGEPILQWHPDQARTPASVMKLLTTLAALDTLGPTYTWRTELYFLGELRGGTLHGDLLLKGYGDPYLVTERLWRLQRELRAAGVRRIDGDLRLDDSWFDVGDYDPAAFDREPLRAYNVAPNALMSNYKVVSYTFRPRGDGTGVDISPEPPLANLQIVNRLSLVPGACRGYQRGIAISANDAVDRVTFSGRFPAGCKRYRMDRTALDHNAYTYGLFRSLWEESGGELTGSYGSAQAPANTEPDLVFESMPLADVVSKINKHSNNVMARQLLFTLGAEAFGPPGTEASGRAAIRGWLAEHGMDFAELKLDNGAGLSRDAKLTARHMGLLLRYGFENRSMPEFLSSLPLSGRDGTLSRRFRSAGLAGVGHLKTGSLDHVSSIGGYLLGRSGARYSVAVLINHEDVHRGTGDEVQEALLRWLRER